MADHDDLSTDSAPPWDEAPAERDENTADIFGDAPAPVPVSRPVVQDPPPETGDAYTVLARKYRPRTFEDLIGQEAMVRTLANAFATGRIA
ncbi:hypothetical protein, partial [Ralstonia pseudosolanacearum]